MAALSFDALLRAVKRGDPDPVYYLHGEEDVLKHEAVRALVDRAVDPGARDFNLDQRTATDLDAEALHALLNTPPMLAERRAVVLRGVEQLRKKSKPRDALLAYLERPSPATLLVLVQGDAEAPEADLTRLATTVFIERLPPERAVRWVAHAAGERELTIEPGAAELLVEALGSDLGALRQELDKLAVLVRGRPIVPEDVAALVGVRHGETLQDLVDATLAREPARAARLVERVLAQSGMTGVRIVSALGTALVGASLSRAELDRGTPRARLADALFRHLLAARPFGLRGYKIEAGQWAEWGEHWSAPKLQSALRLALAIDRALKSTGVSNEGGLVRQLVLSLAVRAREAA
ncbi:MAG: DNA polymerase III subunit delta [Gemmatimonadales bacterium]